MVKSKLRTLGFILLFVFSAALSYSQNPYYIFTADSIRGFNEKAALKEMRDRNMDPEDQMGFMYWKKRAYVNDKYKLGSGQPEDENSYSSSFFSKIPNGNNQTMAAPCVNEGFESGLLTPWVGTRGTNSNSCNYPSTPTVITLGPPFLQINTTPFVDPIVGNVPNSPFPGNRVLKLNDNNNTNPFFSVVKVSQQFSVTQTNFLYEFAYIMIASGSNHTCCDMPYMYVRIRDAINILQTCPNFSILPPSISSTAACPGIGPTTWTTVGGNTYNQGWQKYSIDLTPYMNQNVTVEVFVSDCSQGAHFGYGYFDSNCNTFGITVNNSTVFPAPTQTVNVTAPCATTATLTAPTGLNPYNWNGPPLSAIVNNTNQTISTPVPGDYTLTMNPIGVCNPIVRIVRLSFIPPLGAFATPTAICSAGSNSTAVLTATGATTYTWSTSPPVFTSTTAVTPTATTIYTVTGITTTCSTTQTVQVVVNSSPTIAVNSSSNVVCSGGNVTLTAAGASTYTWFPGTLTGSQVVVSPTASTNYTVLGSNSGCPGQASIGITVISSPTVSAFSSASTVCPGGSANLFAGGAFTYTWQPGNLMGSNVVVTPAATTIYTVTGTILSCTDAETVQVTVSSGPTINITATPTTVCSSTGGTAQLVASGAASYTWQPGSVISPTLVITPTATAVYTVTGVNALLCPATVTISFSVTPTPTLNIAGSSTAICAGNSATLTGSGATAYTWNPGAMTTPVVIVSPAATTNYTLVGANGSCTSSASYSLVVNANPTVTASRNPTVVCSGNSSTLTATGALTYTWNPGALPGATVVVTPASTINYTVTGSNAAGCTATAAAQVSVNITPTVTPAASPTQICMGGSSTLSAVGATTYTWNPGNLNGASVVVSPTATTIYTVSGSNGNCTSSTRTIQILVNPIPTVSAISNPTVICAGNSATLTANGATSYTWNPGSLIGASVVVSPTVNTSYTVVGSNGACTGSAVVSLSVNGTPTLTATANPTSYCAGSGGTSTLTGTGALTYTWNPGPLAGATVTVGPLVTTTYTLSGTNAAGCISSRTVMVTVIPIPTLNVSASPTAICAGGVSTLSAAGATSYTWNPGAMTGANVTVSPVSNTTYTVTGGNGSCTVTGTIAIVVNANPTITASSSPTIVCSGSQSTLTAIGALTYTWQPGSLPGSPVTVSPLVTTNYTVTGTNAAGCTATAAAQVSVNTTPTINPIATPTAICAGATATLSSVGATSYTWNPGNLSGSSVTVSPGSTTVYTVTGSNGICTDTKTVQLVVNPIPTVTAVSNPTVICAANPATLTGSGATFYTWLPGSLTGTSVVVNPTVTTTYTVIGSSLSCTNTATVVVNVNATPTVIASATPTNICSGTGGSATLSAVGAVSYIWNPGTLLGASVVVTPTASTTYTVIGSSPAGCLGTATVFIQITPSPTLNPIASPTSICIGNSSTLTTTGATTYTWMPGSITGSSTVVSPVISTVYTVTGTNGICNSSATVAVIVNPNPTVNASSNPTAICAGSTATLTGTGASTYTWNPGSLVGASVAVSPVATTVYTVVGTNSLGCTGTRTVQLIVNPLPTVTAVANPTGICQGSGGSSTLSASGASTYVWNPGSLPGATVVVTPTSSIVYTVTGTSSLGCVSTRTVSVQIIPNPTVNPTASPISICPGNSSTLTATGATNYTWTPGPLTGSSVVVSPTATTVYTVIGSNAQCVSSTKTVQVGLNPVTTMTVSTTTPIICSGQSASISVLGNYTVFTANPGNIIGINSFTVAPVATTIYTISGANTSGCTTTRTLQITVNPTPTITAAASPSNLCNGGSTTLSATGATSYTWLPVAVTGGTIVVTPTANTTYTVIGSNGNCSSTRTVQVNVGTTPTITAVANPTLKCGPTPATLTANGATSYTWYPGALSGSMVVVNPASTTVYTVVGANGSCTSIATVTLFSSSLPPVNALANPANICSGNSSTLTGVGASSYTWFPGPVTGQTIVVTPSVTTVYTVVGSNAAGCTNAATRTINVSPSPTLSPVSNPTAICLGNSATLTVSGANNYTWFPGPVTGSNIVVTPTTTTNYTVTGNIGPCTSTAVLNLIVNPSPTAITVSASNTLVCASSPVTLTASGATNYTWMPGSFAGAAIVVNPLVTTTYTVTGANLSGCTKTAAITVSISPGPSITISASNNTVCAGTSVTLTPSGATSYTLYPGSTAGTVFITTPTITTTYTILGANSVGCAGVNTIQIIVNPIPSLTITASPSNSLCIGNTATLMASGANSYTWATSPLAVSPTVIVNPTVTTIYSVTALSAAGCQTVQTYTVYVSPVPTINVSSTTTLVCESNSVGLTATGAINYTWLPGSLSGSNVVVNPSATTVYTVSGNNGGCNSTATIQVNVTPGPQSVTANATGTITCFVSSVGLLGNTTSTNVSYLWNGPNSYTSAVQNPTPITQSGTYTLTVTDLNTGCPLSVTCAVVGNTTIPNFSVTSSGDLGCNTTVTLMASSSTSAGITYTWSGPGSFTSAIQNPTINVAGNYTVSAFDISTGCVGHLTISVISNTNLPIISATIIPATCTGTSTNNDGTIILGPNGVKYDLVAGGTYTGTATYATAAPIPTNGIITNTLPNPTILTPYVVRIFGSNGCFKDTLLLLHPVNCANNMFGLTKAASTPTLINNKYEVTFTITVVNDSFGDLTNIDLEENLSVTFPLPTTYTIISPPVVSQGSSITINPLFDGSTHTHLTNASTSTLLATRRDTITFTLRIDPKGYFGTFYNSVVGTALDFSALIVSDSSNNGFLWDPDQDGFPTNNNTPTPINFSPNTRLGIAKAGKLSEKLSDNTYDITYVITVKNFGNDTLKFVQVKDSLAKTVPLPANFTIKNAPSVTGTLLTANSSFNGSSDINLLTGTNSLAPGQVDSIRFTINVSPDTVTVYRNTAIGYAINQFSTATRDSSQTGNDPDMNANGNPNEVSDSDPTVIIIPLSDFFVPEVFTPNDDGKNDFFVIKGGKKLKLTVFNRWGNKVYEKAEYDNTWNGYPNASGLIIGNNKLPQGTYYYIIEFSDAENKPMTGYVVLQY